MNKTSKDNVVCRIDPKTGKVVCKKRKKKVKFSEKDQKVVSRAPRKVQMKPLSIPPISMPTGQIEPRPQGFLNWAREKEEKKEDKKKEVVPTAAPTMSSIKDAIIPSIKSVGDYGMAFLNKITGNEKANDAPIIKREEAAEKDVPVKESIKVEDVAVNDPVAAKEIATRGEVIKEIEPNVTLDANNKGKPAYESLNITEVADYQPTDSDILKKIGKELEIYKPSKEIAVEPNESLLESVWNVVKNADYAGNAEKAKEFAYDVASKIQDVRDAHNDMANREISDFELHSVLGINSTPITEMSREIALPGQKLYPKGHWQRYLPKVYELEGNKMTDPSIESRIINQFTKRDPDFMYNLRDEVPLLTEAIDPMEGWDLAQKFLEDPNYDMDAALNTVQEDRVENNPMEGWEEAQKYLEDPNYMG